MTTLKQVVETLQQYHCELPDHSPLLGEVMQPLLAFETARRIIEKNSLLSIVDNLQVVETITLLKKLMSIAPKEQHHSIYSALIPLESGYRDLQLYPYIMQYLNTKNIYIPIDKTI